MIKQLTDKYCRKELIRAKLKLCCGLKDKLKHIKLSEGVFE